jgi:2'-5' RNA ligase
MKDTYKYHAVIGLLDDSSQRIFDALWRQLAAKGLESRVAAEGLPPHVTFAIYEGLSDARVLSWAEAFSKKEVQLAISFNHIGTFADQTVFLAPRVSDELLAFHKRYHSRLEEYHGKAGWNFTPSSEEWVPHATVMHNSPEENKAAIPFIMEQFAPFKAKIESLAVYKFYPSDRMAVFPLKG